MAGSTVMGWLFVAVGSASLALAIAMLVLAVRNRSSRVLALVLATHAAWTLPFGAGLLVSSQADSVRIWASMPYGVILFGLPALYLALVFPRPRLRGVLDRLAWLPFAAAGLVVCVFVLRDPSLFYSYTAPVTDPLGPFYDQAMMMGPIGKLAVPANHLLVLVAAAILVAASLRIKDRGSRRLATIATVGIMAPVIGGCGAMYAFFRLQNPVGFLQGAGLLLVVDLLVVVEAITLGLLIAFLVVQMRRGHRTARTLLVAVAGFLSTTAVVVAIADSVQGSMHPGYLISGLFASTLLLGDLLLGYAILRRQIFDLDPIIKDSLSRGTVAAAFVAAFFVVTELVATVLSDALGLLAGLSAAGLLVFALAPLMRTAERLSDAAMPGIRPVDELGAEQRLDMYRQQVLFAVSDGTLSSDERRMLDFMRKRFGIEAAAAKRIEADVGHPDGLNG